MNTVELSAGTIEYEDTGGPGPVIVFVHGVLMDSSTWRAVISELAVDHRCVAPTLPLGAHLHPLRAGSDHSMRGIANLLVEFLERLDLSDVTLVVNDWGGPLLFVAEQPERVKRLVITSCEAFDNVMPGVAGRAALVSTFLPGSFFLNAQLMRSKALRRMPFALGSLAKRPIPADIFDRWMGPSRNQSAVRRDLIKYLRGVRGYRRELLNATEQLTAFDRPALVVWAKEDRDMPLEHGRKIAALLPKGRLVEMADSYALIPLDQPVQLASLIRQFVVEPTAKPLTARPG
jgi:pimeloyl-ACP methyl ester carboxylesterase